MLALGFALIIVIGALLLSLPFATRSREGMPFLDALFTATSATCVTGLVVADTYQNWSLFGQLVILALIQIGGLGFITIGSYIAVVMKKKIGGGQAQTVKATAGAAPVKQSVSSAKAPSAPAANGQTQPKKKNRKKHCQ